MQEVTRGDRPLTDSNPTESTGEGIGVRTGPTRRQVVGLRPRSPDDLPPPRAVPAVPPEQIQSYVTPPGSAATTGEHRAVRPGDAATAGHQGPVMSVESVSKVFHPSPRWMKLLLKSAIDEPVIALDDVSFTLERGETCVVVGPNGAGKSTLFRILTGLTTASSGRASILGYPIDEGRTVRSLIGYMPAEDRNLMLRHTCAQNLEFRGRLQGIPRHELPDRVADVLDRVGIGHTADRAATSLSTGMKARLQLAAALLHEPEVLILDEPTSAVDPVGAHELLTLIEGLTHERGLTVVLSSHRLEEIDALDDKVIFLDQGRVIHNGNLRELRQLWEQPRYRFEFDPAVETTALGTSLTAAGYDEVDVVDQMVEIATDRPIGDIIASLGPAANGMLSADRVVMPLRVLFHKLVTGEITGQGVQAATGDATTEATR